MAAPNKDTTTDEVPMTPVVLKINPFASPPKQPEAPAAVVNPVPPATPVAAVPSVTPKQPLPLKTEAPKPKQNIPTLKPIASDNKPPAIPPVATPKKGFPWLNLVIILTAALLLFSLGALLVLGGEYLKRSNAPTATMTPTPTINTSDESSTRNNLRTAHLEMIFTAINEYITDNSDLKETAPLSLVPDCPENGKIGSKAGNIDLGSVLVPEYIEALPVDPLSGSSLDTAYVICRELNSDFTLTAPAAEGGSSIKMVAGGHF